MVVLVPIPNQGERQCAISGRRERRLEVVIQLSRQRIGEKSDLVALIEDGDRRGLPEVVQERVAMRMARHEKCRIG